ncbi:Nicotinamide-nucleotide amidohydrolase PncC [Rosistilla ulvae]|uniref:Nicotinamide-nucleotide amidohydrolase PncC n=1 Tax=Rosistilla ulvae TaxID=1930277 RepID=A0A517LYH7_9BACT|nr:CinA family protein [Rosistilla ulvae]QDS87685.1 Nicotinamide-nucleotide amidohydrolase PncC [Rosistilla ulvae]
MITLTQRVADRLTEHQTKIVFAESCTAGLVAATLASIPGISRWLCGSVVTYRESMKIAWLGVDEADLLRFTAVSQPVTEQMVAGVIRKTGDADVAAAITGHLGPDAPPELDGIVFVSIARRSGDGSLEIETSRHQLKTTGRTDRQREAVDCLMADLLKRL